jgi:preprotein translocase subunit SecG
MENFDLLNNDLQVSVPAQNFLSECAKWGKFLAIIGFILCGIMVVLAFFIPALIMNIPPYNAMAPSLSSGLAAGMTIMYIIFALLFFFPCLYLYKFSVKMKSSLAETSQENFDESLQNLKSMFKFYGIVTIVMLSIYARIFLVAMLGVAFNG